MHVLPQSDWLSLAECLHLIIEKTGAEETSAKKSLISAFQDAKIPTRGIFNISPSCLVAPILTTYWSGAEVDWEVSAMRVPHRQVPVSGLQQDWEFTNIEVCRWGTLHWLSHAEGRKGATHLDEKGEPLRYSTPYLNLMMRAIREMPLHQGHQNTHENIADWLRQEWKRQTGEQLSGRMSGSMASILVEPSRKDGGYMK